MFFVFSSYSSVATVYGLCVVVTQFIYLYEVDVPYPFLEIVHVVYTWKKQETLINGT